MQDGVPQRRDVRHEGFCCSHRVPSCLLGSDGRRGGPGLSGGIRCFRDEPLVLGTLGTDQAGPRILTAFMPSS